MKVGKEKGVEENVKRKETQDEEKKEENGKIITN